MKTGGPCPPLPSGAVDRRPMRVALELAHIQPYPRALTEPPRERDAPHQGAPRTLRLGIRDRHARPRSQGQPPPGRGMGERPPLPPRRPAGTARAVGPTVAPSSKALQRHGEPALLSWKMPDPRAIDRGWIFGFHGGGGRRGVSTPGVARPPRCHDPLATTQTRPVPSTVAPRSTSPYADAAAGR